MNLFQKDLLRLSTAGSVDDGKSTLIGRLLVDTQSILEDQMAAVERASRKRGDPYLDLALLTDGLRAEREQGITIDVAYRYFATAKRKFIIADTPGHLQYTRNMVTGISNAELAIILIDARKGISTQSKRHGFLASLLQTPHLLIAVNKMDLVAYDQAVYQQIVADYTDFASKLSIQDLTFIPISALQGDNVVNKSSHMPWYDGTALLHHLENVNIGSSRNLIDFRFPVQLVLRPNQDFRGFAGQVLSGTITPGEPITVLPSGKNSRVTTIYSNGAAVTEAIAGDSVVLTLSDEIDISRGDMIVRQNNLPQKAQQFECTLCWMDETALNPQRTYVLQHNTRLVRAQISKLNYRIDIDTLHREPAETLRLNDIGRVEFTTTSPLVFDPYKLNRLTGGFILIDPDSNNTVAAGVIRQSQTSGSGTAPKRSSPNIVRMDSAITREMREQKAAHKAAVIWLTGMSGAGKSTIAHALEKYLFEAGCHTFCLDGDNVRDGLNGDLGFAAADRTENIRRVAEVAKLAFAHGNIVICTFISPFAQDRNFARSLIPAERFFEIYVNCNLETLKFRDTKGLYARALRGEIKNFTGISSPYEAPATPELIIDTHAMSVEACVKSILEMLKQQHVIH